jgi:tetratricopeptide (TPR) repeat protein
LRALEKDVTKRYQSVTELASDLDKAASSLSTDTGGPGIRWKRRAKRKSRWSKREKIVAWCLIPLCAVLASAGAFCIGWIFFKPAWRSSLEGAKIYAEQQNDYEAMESFARALELAQKQNDGGDAEWQVRRDLGEYYFSEAQRNKSRPDADKAAKQLGQALKIALLKGTNFDKAHILDMLGETENYMNEYGVAEGHYKDAVYFRNDRPGPQGKWLAATLMRQGENYQDEKKYDLARKSMLKAIEVLESSGEKVYIVGYYSELAYVEVVLADYTEADKHYDQCIKLIESTTGKDDPRMGDALRRKIDVLERLGRKQEADMLRAQVH